MQVEVGRAAVENAAHAAKIDEDSTAKRRNTLFESRIGFSKDCLACDENLAARISEMTQTCKTARTRREVCSCQAAHSENRK